MVCVTRQPEDFSIPELPGGQNMVINIKTTWGDQHYVGLSGIEIFADTGKPVAIAKVFLNEYIHCLWYVDCCSIITVFGFKCSSYLFIEVPLGKFQVIMGVDGKHYYIRIWLRSRFKSICGYRLLKHWADFAYFILFAFLDIQQCLLLTAF